jgi:hypothetical protein
MGNTLEVVSRAFAPKGRPDLQSRPEYKIHGGTSHDAHGDIDPEHGLHCVEKPWPSFGHPIFANVDEYYCHSSGPC